jgi:O-antigen ligase
MLTYRSEDIKIFIRNGGLTFVCCLLAAIMLPVHIHWLPPVMILWVLIWILESKSRIKKDLIIDNKSAVLFFLFIIFFLWQIFGLFLADSFNDGIERLFKRLLFLLFPLVLFYPGSRIIKNINLIIRLFAVCTFVYLLYCFGNALYNSLSVQNHNWIFNPHPEDYTYENFFYGSRLSDPVHPSYLAMYLVMSILISSESLFDTSVSYLKKGLWMALIIVFTVSLFLLSARAGIIAGIIIIPVYFLIKFFKRFPKWLSIIILGSLAVVLVLFAKRNERVNTSIEGITKENIDETLKNDPRLLIWKSALGVVSKNLILGVGTGDASIELQKEFISRGYINGFYGNLNAHNQFLEILLENGLIGLILFLAILSYMAYIAINQQNILLGLFIITTIIFLIFETMFNRLGGVSFFALFSFLLIYAKTNRRTGPIDAKSKTEESF